MWCGIGVAVISTDMRYECPKIERMRASFLKHVPSTGRSRLKVLRTELCEVHSTRAPSQSDKL